MLDISSSENTLTYSNFTNSASQTVCVLGTLPVHHLGKDSFFQVLKYNVDHLSVHVVVIKSIKLNKNTVCHTVIKIDS